jgi:cell wall-associated NlpC family hydrolase
MTARSERSAQRTKAWAVSALTTAAVAATALVPADPALAADLTPGNGQAPAALAPPLAPGPGAPDAADPFGLGFGAPPGQAPADAAPAPDQNPDANGPADAAAPGSPGNADGATSGDQDANGAQGDGADNPAPAAPAPAPAPAPGTGTAPQPPAAPPARGPGTPGADPGAAPSTGPSASPSASPGTDSAQTAKDAKADSVRAAESTALHAAAAEKGAPYRWGAAGPDSFDCSGLVVYSYRKAGHRLPRTAAAQYASTHHIAASDRRSGDLVFFHSGSNVYHVGVYAGHNKIWHAPYTGTRVRLERIWTSDVWYGRVGG